MEPRETAEWRIGGCVNLGEHGTFCALFTVAAAACSTVVAIVLQKNVISNQKVTSSLSLYSTILLTHKSTVLV